MCILNLFTTLTINTDLDISNPQEFINFLKGLESPEKLGLFLPLEFDSCVPGEYQVIAHEGLVEDEQGILVEFCPEGFQQMGCADYPLLLWEQIQEKKAKLEATADPEDLYPDSVWVYGLIEDAFC